MKPKILCVEDEEGFAKLLSLYLKDYDIDIAENAQQAIRYFINCNEYKAIITDLNLPGVNGIDLIAILKILRKYTKCFPKFIITTAYVKKGDGGYIEADVTLAKPYSKAELIQAIEGDGYATHS